MSVAVETTIIMPVFNELNYLRCCLDSLLANTYDKNKLEILILDGKSDDGTIDIIREYESRFPFIKMLVNEQRFQVHALNIGINHASGDYIIRCDAHSEYPSNYIETLVGYLKDSENTDIGNVGGQAVSHAGSNTMLARAIEVALKYPLGVGVSHRSVQVNKPTEVDTILFGAWKKSIFSEVGDFDKTFVRGQDYEHNVRIKQAGYRLLLLPGVSFKYFTRTTVRKLMGMLFQYAHAKIMVMRKHKQAPNIRSFIPALFVLMLLLSIFISPLRYIALFYLFLVIVGAGHAAFKYKDPVLWPLLAFLFPVQHLSHGCGMFRGLVDVLLLRQKTKAWQGTR